MAGLHPPLPAHSPRDGTHALRRKPRALHTDTGAFHPLELLYLHHDLPLSVSLLPLLSYPGREGGAAVPLEEGRALLSLFPDRGGTRRRDAPSGDLRLKGHRVRGYQLPRDRKAILRDHRYVCPPYAACGDGAGPGSLAEPLLRNCHLPAPSDVFSERENLSSEEACERTAPPLFLSELFHQYPELHLARPSLPEQSAVQTELPLYLHAALSLL